MGSGPIARAIEGTAAAEPSWTGKRIGVYTVQREIGRGGMGVVFEAQRDDNQFHQRVALKIALRATFSAAFRDRFRHERQILAQLEHPNIARLLDGGETAEGLPFFAMEYVEGLPIHTYCEDNKLSLRERLNLFLTVCLAVDYAHQNLVVHRDIKPANILVDHFGVPKLLDFGVAKLLDAAAGPSSRMTQTAFAPVTPDYCSPEQLRNQLITTRTDVYLLGLLLFELLAGRRAQVADTSSPMALERSICASEAPLASIVASDLGDRAMARALQGDLDTIIAKAIRKEPEGRFLSVGELAADIRLHLAGKPIESRPASLRYKVAKFVRRNKLSVAGSAALAATLIAGIVGTTFQARRAARRFDQVRGIARVLMFDVHDAIRVLPGSVAAQQLVVRTALQYLDKLSQEAVGDAQVQIEIAEGYVRIAEIQGGVLASSLDDRTSAKASLDRADQILDSLFRRDPGSERLAANIGESRVSRAEIQARSGESHAARLLLESTDRAIAPLALKPNAGWPLRKSFALVRMTLARDFGTGPDALEFAAKLMEVLPGLEAWAGEHADARQEIAVASSVAGGVYYRAGRLREAVPLLEKAALVNQQILETEPHNSQAHRGLMLAHSKVAELYQVPGSVQDLVKSIESLAKMAQQGEWLYRADPSSKVNRFDYAMSSIRYADAFPPGDPHGLDLLIRGAGILEQEMKRDPADSSARRQWADSQRRIGMRHAERGDWAAGGVALQLAVGMADDLLRREAEHPANLSAGLRVYMDLGKFLAKRRDPSAARRIIAKVEAASTPDLAPRIAKWKSEMDGLLKR